jgi:cysteinyl-tRNA synthetase
MRFYNSLSHSIEEFKPIREGSVGMYHCGPTVYDYAHIGNLRSFVFADLLRRTFEYEGFEVEQVMNITDVGQLSSDADEGEDKMTKGLLREGKPITLEAMIELGSFYASKFKEDLNRLNILPPTHMPKASEHIREDIELISELEAKGFTYTTSDGVYFDTSKDPQYGKLGMLSESMESRIGENTEKKNSRDFALWKLNASMGYKSPWGSGFPGWHIECSAMSKKYLGESFDIHTGGIDLAPIHHNNEIAQSENACGCEFVHYWLHNEFVNVDGEKMAKSGGNILTLRTLEEKGYSPLAYRYFLLQSHYRSKTSFTFEALDSAENAYRKLKEFFATLPLGGKVDSSYKAKFDNAIETDLNTPEALATLWTLVKDEEVSPGDKRATLLQFDKVLGLNLDKNEYEVTNVPEDVQVLLKLRDTARLEKDFTRSDELRDEIRQKGFEVKDTPEGQELKRI